MAIWADEIKLITLQEPDERVSSSGFSNELNEVLNTVFCNRKSVGYAEYFKSQLAGFVLSLKVEVHVVDYMGQKLAEFEGVRYSVLKTYNVDDDTIELTLSDLREQDNTSEV